MMMSTLKRVLQAVAFVLMLSFPRWCHAQVSFYPPFWYTGMANDTLEVLIYAQDSIAEIEVQLPAGVQLLEKTRFKNKRYASILLHLSPTMEAAKIRIEINGKRHIYKLLQRNAPTPKAHSQADVMYLITPDRFANGNPKNDQPKGFREHLYGREHPFGRHGGDIQGIMDHLDYLQELGVSSLWISPLLTNDQRNESYHGYAITDHYEIDPRFGSNALYGKLIAQMHQRGMKMVKDMVYNHVGTEHFLFRDLPDSSFFNWHPGRSDGFRQTNYRATTVMDPHRSKDDYLQFQDGWFVRHMPDINQRNPHMARFLIQNSIWWIETYGVDAFRIDTYIYPDQPFMARLAKEVKQQYPQFFIFGETWVHGQAVQSYFAEQMRYNPLNTHMDGVTDFQMHFALNDAVHNKQGWTEGAAKIYYALAADYLYAKPEMLVTFLDNHDMGRFAGNVKQDWNKLTLGYNWLLTLRGIPCIYYGSEIGMEKTENHGLLREDFPGGWAGDTANAFVEEGRSPRQDSMFDYLNTLLKWRAGSDAVTKGELTQFVPDKNIYVYFRHSENDTVMVIANTDDKEQAHSLLRYEELWPIGSRGINVLTQEEVVGTEITIPAKTSYIIQMVR